MGYIFCTFENASAMLAPYFQDADGYNKNSPATGFFFPISSMDTRFLALMRVESDRCTFSSDLLLMYAAHMFVVLALAGGAGFSGSIESVAELRVHAQAMRGIKPLPAWLFSVLDNLEAQESDYPGKYSKANICKSAFHDKPRHVLTVDQRQCTGSSTTNTRPASRLTS
jgi:hypothetical protein